MRRLTWLWLATVLVFCVLWGCSSDSDDGCTVVEDCVGGEECIEGICQPAEESQGEPNDDPNDAANDDPNDAANDAPNQNQSDVDCFEEVGICDDLYCHPDLRECVECVRNDHCDGALECDDETNTCICAGGTHDCDGECVSSDDPAHCGDRCEPCPDEEGAQAVCDGSECGLECEAGFDICSGPDCETHCVECEANADCTDPLRPRCEAGACESCVDADDCAHLADASICDPDTQACVECSLEDMSACENNSCDPGTGECTDTPINSLSFCEACVADIECSHGQRCVPMFFKGQPRPGGYCLYEEGDQGCSGPASIPLERQSVSGAASARYCGINEAVLTCEALHDYGLSCEADDECGTPDLDDAMCTWFSGDITEYRCSHNCDDDLDCNVGAYCASPADICLET